MKTRQRKPQSRFYICLSTHVANATLCAGLNTNHIMFLASYNHWQEEIQRHTVLHRSKFNWAVVRARKTDFRQTLIYFSNDSILSLSSNCVLCSAGWWNHNRLRKTSAHARQGRSPSGTGNLLCFVVLSSRRSGHKTGAKSGYTEVPFSRFWISSECVSYEAKAKSFR